MSVVRPVAVTTCAVMRIIRPLFSVGHELCASIIIILEMNLVTFSINHILRDLHMNPARPHLRSLTPASSLRSPHSPHLQKSELPRIQVPTHLIFPLRSLYLASLAPSSLSHFQESHAEAVSRRIFLHTPAYSSAALPHKPLQPTDSPDFRVQ
ncbi:unnamed protein product [Fraxinus pennsylvanica]|uniref:Uncharacterized protein n=1 Tax=Fraxinus pennsylvanica TaxID=56036 RepID=A0AAD1Z2X8_9LAMI|nr:unnamed protein product [Fraxinus pennsylvanica]